MYAQNAGGNGQKKSVNPYVSHAGNNQRGGAARRSSVASSNNDGGPGLARRHSMSPRAVDKAAYQIYGANADGRGSGGEKNTSSMENIYNHMSGNNLAMNIGGGGRVGGPPAANRRSFGLQGVQPAVDHSKGNAAFQAHFEAKKREVLRKINKTKI